MTNPTPDMPEKCKHSPNAFDIACINGCHPTPPEIPDSSKSWKCKGCNTTYSYTNKYCMNVDCAENKPSSSDKGILNNSEERFLFRAWDNNHQAMHYSENCTLDWLFDLPKRHGGAVMQCTGLRDKNGKLIYEGDIITWPTTPILRYSTEDGGPIWGDQIMQKGVVSYKKAYFMIATSFTYLGYQPAGEKTRGGHELMGITHESIKINNDRFSPWTGVDGTEDHINKQEVIGNIYENPTLLLTP